MLDFNVSPYYDDFEQNKHFHKLLFRPGRSVQARELNQMQTILQDQISKFADNIFAQNTPISGGALFHNKESTKLELYYDDTTDLKQYTNLDITKSLNKLITNDKGSIISKIIVTDDVILNDSGNVSTYPSVIIQDIDEVSGVVFAENDYIYSYETKDVIAKIKSVSKQSTVSISDGTFYIVHGYSYSKTPNPDGTYPKYTLGYFVKVDSQVISVIDDCKVGLGIYERIIDHVDDFSLLDPALGTSNFQAPGADRYVIDLKLEYRPISDTEVDFIELLRLNSGEIVKAFDDTVYKGIENYVATRIYDIHGNFVAKPFTFTPIPQDDDEFAIQIGEGVGYVNGHRVYNKYNTKIIVPKAQEISNTASAETISYGDYFVINSNSSIQTDPKYISGLQLDLKNNSSVTIGTCEAKIIVSVGKEPRIYVQNINLNVGSLISNVNYLVNPDKINILTTRYTQDSDGDDKLLFDLRSDNNEHIKKLTGNVSYETYVRKESDNISSNAITFTFENKGSRDNVSDSMENNILLSNTFTPTKFTHNKSGDASIVITPTDSSDLNGKWYLMYKTSNSSSVDSVAITTTWNSFNANIIASSKKASQKKFNNKYIVFYPNHGVFVYKKPNIKSGSSLILPLCDVCKVLHVFALDAETPLTKDTLISDDSIISKFSIDYGQTKYLRDYTKLTLNKGQSIDGTKDIVICFDYLTRNNTIGIYCANSYENVPYDKIPKFNSGTSTSLIHYLDLRPYRENFTSTIINNTLNIIPSSVFNYNKDYYLPRIDILYLNSEGQFEIKSGVPNLKPNAPEFDSASNEMKLAEVSIDAFTYDPTRDVGIKIINNQRYTLREMYDKLEKLDKKTATPIIMGSTSSIKQNSIEDNLTSYTNAAWDKAGFSIMIDTARGIMSPKVEVDRYKLTPSGTTNNPTFTLGTPENNVKIFTMPLDTNSISLIDSSKGKGYVNITSKNPPAVTFLDVYPSMESWFDRTVEPSTAKTNALFGALFKAGDDRINTLNFVDWKSLIGYKKDEDFFVYDNIPLTLDNKPISIKGYGFKNGSHNIYIGDNKIDIDVTETSGTFTTNVTLTDLKSGDHDVKINNTHKSKFFAKALLHKNLDKTSSPSIGGFYDELLEHDEINPLAQVFTIGQNAFLKKLTLYGKCSDISALKSNAVINVCICETSGKMPNGKILDYSSKTITVKTIFKDTNTSYTLVFDFDAPVFIKKDTSYAIIVQSNDSTLSLKTSNNDDNKNAQLSNLYLFQNAKSTRSADTNKLDLNLEGYKFNINPYVIEFKLKDIGEKSYDWICGSTTHFIPGGKDLKYSIGDTDLNMGIYGTPYKDDQYVTIDKKSVISVTFNSNHNHLSPIISDDGLNIFGIKPIINNLELDSDLFDLTSPILGIPTTGLAVTFEHNQDSGEEASGTITSSGAITITKQGSGYINKPKIMSGGIDYSANFSFKGELEQDIGNADCRYISKVFSLADNDVANNINIKLNAVRPKDTNIYVFYKTLPVGERFIETKEWKLMYNTATKFPTVPQDFTFLSSQRNTIIDPFNKYQIKIVLTTKDNKSIPKIHSFKIITFPG